ncbi:hypothetical protein LEP1GSC162_0760 [Leptospira santarosai str. CBC1531]|nr:hypothetical protein LEP1GSC162_0760 [Leptospira santarosai str. CBC1531]
MRIVRSPHDSVFVQGAVAQEKFQKGAVAQKKFQKEKEDL